MHHTNRDKARPATQMTRSTTAREPDQKDIRFRAYQIYIARNREPGHALDHWLQAEHELLSRN